jgi:hypothetical protein
VNVADPKPPRPVGLDRRIQSAARCLFRHGARLCQTFTAVSIPSIHL